jgi:hypothetical protein
MTRKDKEQSVRGVRRLVLVRLHTCLYLDAGSFYSASFDQGSYIAARSLRLCFLFLLESTKSLD